MVTLQIRLIDVEFYFGDKGGTAFKASVFPESRCKSCFDGEPMEIVG